MVVLFDLDGTLVDHEAGARAGAIAVHERLGLEGGSEAFCAAWRAALERHYARYLEGHLSFEEQRRARVREVVDATLDDRAADEMFDVYLTAYEAAIPLFGDALVCLDRLSDHRLGIVTNGHTSRQRAKLERHGLLERFEHVVTSEECGCAKPAGAIFRNACGCFEARPEDVVYIGDHYEVDAVGARSAGLRGVWLDRRGAAGSGHLPPLIRSLRDLPALLEDD